MKKLTTLFLLALFMACSSIVKGEEVTVIVEYAGDLQNVIDALDATQITTLHINGELNGEDIATLRSMEGKLSSLSELDLKNVTLISDDHPYYQSAYHGDGVWYTNYTRYFISKERKHVRWSDGLSQSSPQYEDFYDYNLAGAFQGLPIKRIVLPSSINEIGRDEFKGCTNLVEIVMENLPVFVGKEACNGCSVLQKIPSTKHLTAIEESAFAGCTVLIFDDNTADISLLDSIPQKAFYGCKQLKQVNLSSVLKYVDCEAFRSSGINTIVLPVGMRTLGSKCFADCPNLSHVDIPSDLYRIPYDIVLNTPYFNGQDRLSSGVRYIGNIAAIIDGGTTELVFKSGTIAIADNFNGNMPDVTSKVQPTSVLLPSSVRYIGACAFQDARLKVIDLPNNLESIGVQAFFRCAELSQVMLPVSLQNIGEEAFKMSAVKEFNISANVTSIGQQAFADNSKLESVIYSSAYFEVLYPFSNCTALRKIIFNGNLLSIPTGCCRGCTSLEQISLPENLESIGEYAFYECKRLREVVVPENVKIIEGYSFQNCSGLRKLTLGSQVRMIYNYAFNGLNNLRELNYNPINATYYYKGGLQHGYAFNTLDNLEKLTIGKEVSILNNNIWPTAYPSLKKIDYQAENLSTTVFRYFQSIVLDTLVIGKDVISLAEVNFGNFSGIRNLDYQSIKLQNGEGYFSHTEYLSHVRISEGVAIIPRDFFYNCNSLEEVDLPSTIKTIGNTAFMNCSKLAKLHLPDSVESIGVMAFWGCPITNLSDFELPFNLRELGRGSFHGANICRLTINENLHMAEPAFDYLEEVVYNAKNESTNECVGFLSGQFKLKKIIFGTTVKNIPKNLCSECVSLEEVSFNESLDSIGDGGFSRCPIQKIELPHQLSYIGDWAFDKCSIKKLQLPENLEYLGNHAFQDNESLKEIVLPASLTYIGYGTFSGCDSIIMVRTDFQSDGFPQIWSDTFSEVTYVNGTLYIPAGTRNLYQSTEKWSWSKFVNIVDGETPVSNDVAINETNFPDENFRNWILSQDYGTDGVLTKEEIAEITSISILTDKNIECLDGIGFFSALTTLNIRNNKIASLDVSNNTELTSLNCINNQLETLDVSNNKKLTTLYCSGNQLTMLNVTGCKELIDLNCYNNQLTSLGVSGCVALQTLVCYNNQLTSLEVSGCTVLRNLYCYQNQIKGTAMDALVESLPVAINSGTMRVMHNENEGNVMTIAQVAAAKAKNWTPQYMVSRIIWREYVGSNPVLRGDANGDGKVDMDDATFVTNIILGTEVATEVADVNNDGKVSMSDAMFIVNKILKGKFPDEE